MQKDLLDKNIFVTGSSRGIGRETALTLARNGANIVIHANSDATNAARVVDDQIARKRARAPKNFPESLESYRVIKLPKDESSLDLIRSLRSGAEQIRAALI